MITEHGDDFEYRTLKRDRFLWVRFEKKRLREGRRVSTVWTFEMFGLHWSVSKVQKLAFCGHGRPD